MDESFHDRERQFEAKFAHDEEILFKVRVHRDRAFALWVADALGGKAPAGYADALTTFAFTRKPEEVVAKATRDLEGHGMAQADIKARRAFEKCADQAREEVMKTVAPEA